MEDQDEKPLTKRERRELAREEKKEEQLKDQNTKKLKSWFIGLVVLIGLVVIGYKAWVWINTPSPSTPSVLDIQDSDWVKGKQDAKVTLVEFGDFECPACAVYATSVEELSNTYPDDLRVVYRHYPLPQHKNAVPSAKAAEAAGLQGNFWEMYDVLYAKQDDWAAESNPTDKFVDYAKGLGLDENKFKADMDNPDVAAKIKADENGAIQLGINATPTFYINGSKMKSVSTFDEFKKLVDDAVKK